MKILILSKKSLFALHEMRCLSDLKVECHIFGQGIMPAVALSKYCHRYVSCDFGTTHMPNEAVMDRLNKYCLKRKITFVIAGDYDTSYFFSKFKSRLDPRVVAFPLPKPETLEMLHDKWEFTQLLNKLRLPYPRTILIKDPNQLSSVNMHFPCLVKSLRCEGGYLLKYIKQDQEDLLMVRESLSNFPLVVQEFIPGKDISVGILAHQGKILAWAMYEFIDPYTQQFFCSDELLNLVGKIVAATNYEGVADFDLRFDERNHSFYFIECNPRFWNSLRACKQNGVNFIALGLALAEGKMISNRNISKNICYILPGKVLSDLKKGKLLILKNIPQSTRKDLMQMFNDPFSLACSIISKEI